jgi:hypothetical protein
MHHRLFFEEGKRVGQISFSQRFYVVLKTLTQRWWFFAVLLVLFFLPAYSAEPFDQRQSPMVIQQVLKDPLIYRYPFLMPLTKAITALLVMAVFIFGNRVRRVFNIYMTVIYLGLALFQTSAFTEDYGFVVISGNLVLVFLLALGWGLETLVERNDFSKRRIPFWKWWVAPLALLAFLAPVSSNTLAPDFNLLGMLSNPACLTYCMLTPLVIAIMTLFHPTVDLPLLRLMSFVGIIFGLVNIITWFVISPEGWWMGILHLPLLLISIYGFVLSLDRFSSVDTVV